jgi:hypothetical protein
LWIPLYFYVCRQVIDIFQRSHSDCMLDCKNMLALFRSVVFKILATTFPWF